MLGNLARAARSDVLMAFAATLCVVDRPQAVLDVLDLLEQKTVVVERAQRHDVRGVQSVEGRPLAQEAVGLIVEACRRLVGTRRQHGLAVVVDGRTSLDVGLAFHPELLGRLLCLRVASRDKRGRCRD